MKKLLSIICVAAMLFSCMVSYNVSADTTTVKEYITNGNFDGGNNGWTVPYGDWSVITDSSTGNKMVKMAPYACNLRQLDIELPVGTYELSFRAKSDNADYTTEILVDYANDVNVKLLSTTFDVKSAGFSDYKFVFTVETAGKYNVKIGKNGGDPQNKYIDDVSLVEYIEPEVDVNKEYITNGNFDGEKNGWTVPYGDWSVITDSSTGNKMVKMAPYACNLRQLDIELPVGTYELSFRAKSDNADYTTEILVDYANDVNVKLLSTTFDVKSAGFSDYKFVFTVETAGKYNVKIGKNGGDPQNKYIDDVSLIAYVEPEVEVINEFVTNGSFDEGNTGWTVPYTDGKWGVITDSANSMMKIQAYQSNLRQLDIELPAGKYVLSFRAKSDDADFSSPVLVDGTATVLSSTFDFKCAGFVKYTFVFDVVAAGKYNIKLGGNGTDKYNKYFDDVSLKTVTDERIKNGDFDDGINGWYNNFGDTRNDGVPYWQINTDSANGNNVMKLMPYHGMMCQSNILLIAGESYTLSFDAQYDTNGAPFSTYALVVGSKNTQTEGAELLNAEVVLDTTNANTYTYSLTPTVTGYYEFKFGHPQGSDPQIKYLDKVSITVTPYKVEWVGSEDADIYESDEYILNIPQGWTVNSIVSLYDCSNVEITADTEGTVKTGTVFTAKSGDEVIWTKEAVVIADINGNGKTDLVDLVKMKKHEAQIKLLEGAAFEAGRICGEEDIISEDLVIIRQILLGFIDMTESEKKNLMFLENTYSKLSAGDTVNFAFVGGSVTQGTGGTSGGWPKIVINDIKENFGANCVEYRQSIGGTGSLLDNFRFDFDNEGITPDILFIEFAINDYYKGRTYDEVIRDSESIVRKAYAKNPYIDIVYVLTFDSAVKDTEFTQLAAHKAVAEKYGLMTITLGPKFYKHIAQTGEAFSAYFTDSVHPNDKGYELYANMILEDIYSDMPKTTNVPAEYKVKELPDVMSDIMTDARIVTADKIDVSNGEGWTYYNADFGYTKTKYGGYVSSTKAGSTLTFTFEGTDGGIWYDRSTNLGMVTISIDGGEPIVIDGYSSYHLSDYYVFSGLEDTTHTVTVTKIAEKNAASTGNEFRIGSLLFN